MPTIINESPTPSHAVEVNARVEGSELILESSAGTLGDEDQLFVKHRRPAESDPVVVPITVSAPEGWSLTVEHYDGGELQPWPRDESGRCQLTWAETEGEKKVVVTATPPPSTNQPAKRKTVFIKVGPDPELPV